MSSCFAFESAGGTIGVMLVGREFLRVAGELGSAWLDSSPRGVRIIVLQGPSGSGKTRLVQSFYEQVVALADAPTRLDAGLPLDERGLLREPAVEAPDRAAGQEAPAPSAPSPAGRVRYWPPTLLEPVAPPLVGATGQPYVATDTPEWAPGGGDPVFPGGAWSPPSGSRLSVFWWGMRARRGGCAALEHSGQIDAHLAGLTAAIAAGDDLTRTRVKALLDISCWTNSVAALALLSGTPLAPVAVAKAALDVAAVVKDIPGVVTGLRDSGQSRQGMIEQALRPIALRELDLSLGRAGLDSATNAFRALAQVAGIVPFAIAVDDAHDLDEATLDGLRALAVSSTARAVIILTVNTDAPASDRARLGEWIDAEQQRPGSTLVRLDIPALTPPELTELAVARLDEGLDPAATAAVVAAAQGRPGPLVDLLDQSLVTAALIGGADLPDPLRARDKTARSADWFTRLDPDTRTVLATAALTGQHLWLPWLTNQASALTPDGLQQAIAAGWLATTGDGQVASFANTTLHRVALDRVDDLLLPAAQRAALEALAGRQAAARDDDTLQGVPVVVREAQLEALTGPAAQRLGVVADQWWIAELLRLHLLTGRTDHDRDLLAATRDRLTGGALVSPVAVVATAQALFTLNDAQAAMDRLTAEYQRLVDQYGPDSPATLPPLTNLAAAWTALASANIANQDTVNTAVTLLRRVLDLRYALLRPGQPIPRTIPDTRRLALLLERAGRPHDAVDAGQDCVDEHLRCPGYGPDHAATLTARGNLAGYLHVAGHTDQAIPVAEQVLADKERILGPDHPATLTTRGNIADYLDAVWHTDQAIPMAEQVLADRERILGPDHPDTLTARGNLAGYLDAVGRTDQAIPMAEQVLADRERVLGHDHPDTLTTRGNLAGYLDEVGRTDEAIRVAEHVLADSARVLGPVHPYTLNARRNLANYLHVVGGTDDAIALAEQVLADSELVLGPDHPTTLATQNNLAGYLDAVGRTDEAISLAEQVLADSDLVLGPDHPTSFITRSNLASYLHAVGRTNEAIPLAEQALVAFERVRGPDHPATRIARRHLAGLRAGGARP